MSQRSLLATGVAAAAALCPAILLAEEDAAALFGEAAKAATSATAEQPARSSPPEAPTMLLRLSGAHGFEYHHPAYPHALSYDGEMKAPAFRNDVGLEVRAQDIKLVSRWAFDVLMMQSAEGETLRTGFSNGQLGSWNTLARLRPLESFLSYAPAGTGLRLAFGYQIFAWGVADKINPTDNLNPRDYTTGVIDPLKIPVLAADLNWYPTDSVHAEAVFLPYETPDRWPLDYAGEARAATGTTGEVGYRPLRNSPRSSVGGGRLAFHGSAGDASVSYLYDFDSYYSPRITGALYSPAPSAEIELERARVHRIGADGKVTLSKLGLWLEANATVPEHARGETRRKPRLDYVAGMDVNYGPNDRFYVNVQYFGSYVDGYDRAAFDRSRAFDLPYAEAFYRRSLANALAFDTEGLLQGAAVNLKWELFDAFLTPQLKAVYIRPFFYDDSQVIRYGSTVLNPELDFMPADSFHVLLGAHLAYAWAKKRGTETIETDTTRDRFGIYTQFNNVYLKVQYKWNLDLAK